MRPTLKTEYSDERLALVPPEKMREFEDRVKNKYGWVKNPENIKTLIRVHLKKGDIKI